ncbi:MAG: rRNA cytosine-C5-methyltransferase [Acidobacteriia bacterium]|nr:rRNA cytosine-C5-methyltransferase [Terriglobia bacterium]
MRPENACADPRSQAVKVLARVETQAAHAARLLGDASPAVRELVMGTLRWQLTLDSLLERHLRQPMAALDALVRSALRVGLYEARRMRTPAPVAVAEAVRLTKAAVPRAAGLVNAVLRRAVTESWPDVTDAAVPLSVRYSHPAWLLERWLALFGEQATVAALAADQEVAPLYLLASVSHLDELAAAGCSVRPHPVVTGIVTVSAGTGVAVAALQAGRAYAIDPTAAAVARLLPEVDGLTVDLAAAPGGKSLVLASERPQRRVLAADRHLGRAVLMSRNFRLVAPAPVAAVADAAAPPLRPRSCGAVLVDAPCSGTGTLRRHPEIRWRLRAGDLYSLSAVQRRMAAAAAELVAPGGFLLYATCSLEPEENADVVAALSLEAVPVAARLPSGLGRVELSSGGVAIPPGAAGDGFTVHLLRRGA